jgi:hypothetical protein
MTTPTLPVSPIAVTGAGPTAQAGIVQINLAAPTSQIVTGAEFGLGTIMGDSNHSYLPYADPSFQAVANQYPTDLLRHNWELNTMMDVMFPSRGSASSPNFFSIDNYLNQQGNLKSFFNNQTGTQIVTLGFPSWLDISNPSDQALYAGIVKQIAQHFIAAGEPVQNYELVNEPDGHYNITDMANTFNVVAQALKSVDPNYKLGGLTESYLHTTDLQTFFQIAGPNVGFVSWHQYVTNGSDGKSDQQVVTDSMDVEGNAQTVRAEMRAAGIADSVPLFLGEYNVDGANYNDPNNANMVGAVAAAAATYGMIHSNTNMTMGALWDVENDSAYSVFGLQGAFHVDSVGVVLAGLTAYMPGQLVQTIMPNNTPGLVGYTTRNGEGFSTALIDTNLSHSYTVDLSKTDLPAAGLFRVEVSNANPRGSRTSVTDLAHVTVAAGSVVIITNEAPHGGTEFSGLPNIIPTPAPTPTSTPSPTPAPASTLVPEPTTALIPGPTPTPTATQSANNTIITGTTSAIIDASGNKWTITADGQVAANSAADKTTANVVALAYVNGKIWQENVNSLWWGKTSPAAVWAPGPGTSTSPLPSSVIPAFVTIPAAQASATISASGVSVTSTSGNHMVFVSGTGDTVNLAVGSNTITDTGKTNTYVIPAAGRGYDTFNSNILSNHDTLDLRTALAATNWSGTTSSLAKYLGVANTSQGAVLSIAPTSGGAGAAIATVHGATVSDLTTLLAYSIT